MTRFGLKAVLLSVFVFVFGWVSEGAALEAAECSEAHFQAQVARREGRLLAAEAHLSTCGDGTCPGVLVAECGAWLKEVLDEMPSIVVVVKDVREEDVLEYSLEVDGRRFESAPTGALRLDPGKHEIVVRAPGFLERRQPIRLRVGEKNRRIPLLLPDSEPRQEPKARSTWPLWAGGSLAVLGGAGFAVFGSRARSGERALGDCEPTCSDAEVERVSRDYTLANAALGVGVAAALSGGLLWAFSGSRSGQAEAEKSNVQAAERARFQIAVGPRGFLLRGSF